MQFITIPAKVFESFYKAFFVDHKRSCSVVYEGVVFDATFCNGAVSISSYHESYELKWKP